MIDEVDIYVCSGNGGDGAVSFRREKYVPLGGPDGGDGGRGGAISFFAVKGLSTLAEFRGRRRFLAEAGGHGRGRKKTGGNGRDVYLAVPVGTVVSVEREGSQERLLEELIEERQEVVVALGGAGGRGNTRFVGAVNQVPRLAEQGERGQARWVHLELKLLADVGLIGYPNAGKSTFLQAVSAARPVIGAYPFTTLEPYLGVVHVGWQELVVADLPGLVEGAHRGRGLGLRFLRHAERTAVLIHLIDGSIEDPVAAWETVNRELHLFNPGLAEKPQIVAVNKVDMPMVRSRVEAIQREFSAAGVMPHVISAATTEGVGSVVDHAAALGHQGHLEDAKRGRLASVRRVAPRPREERPGVTREDGVFVVRHRRAARLAALTDVTHPEARAQLQKELERMGVMRELERAGAGSGDIVRLGDVELEWQ